jgi:hypothetical protein
VGDARHDGQPEAGKARGTADPLLKSPGSRGARAITPVASVLLYADEPLARLRAAYEAAVEHAQSARKSTMLQGHIRAALSAAGDIQRALVLAGIKANA